MNAQQAIDTADRDGFCHIGQHTYLWKTCEASAHVKVEGIDTPYMLVSEGNWTASFSPVKDAQNKRLIKAIGERT